MAQDSKLLLDDQPLVIQPKLAEALGLNEAIVLQQVHYWLLRSTHEHDGRKWVFNSYPKWQRQFPWWGLNTIKRTITGLETKGMLISSVANQHDWDRTKWYSIDYDALALAVGRCIDPKRDDASSQNGSMEEPKMGRSMDPKCTHAPAQNGTIDGPNLGRPIPETTTEITPEITAETTIPVPRAGKGKLPPEVLEEVIKVETWLEKTRGYVSPRFPAERQSIAAMVRLGYDAGQIGACWQDLKRDKYYSTRELLMMRVQSEIQNWAQHHPAVQQAQRQEEACRQYIEDQERRARGELTLGEWRMGAFRLEAMEAGYSPPLDIQIALAKDGRWPDPRYPDLVHPDLRMDDG